MIDKLADELIEQVIKVCVTVIETVVCFVAGVCVVLIDEVKAFVSRSSIGERGHRSGRRSRERVIDEHVAPKSEAARSKRRLTYPFVRQYSSEGTRAVPDEMKKVDRSALARSSCSQYLSERTR